MAYCTFAQVRAICDTDVTDGEITELITETDAYIDTILNTGLLSATMRQMLSRLYTAWVCMRKDPNARSLGEYSERREITMKMMKDEFNALVATFGGGISFTAAVETLA